MRLLAASFILLLAPLAHGEDRASKVQKLQQDVANPDKFDRYVEGSPELKAGVAGPAAVTPSAAPGSRRDIPGLSRPTAGLRPEQAALPPVPFQSKRRSGPAKDWTPDVPPGFEFALGGAGLLLVGVGLRLWSSAPQPATPAPRPIPLEIPRQIEPPASQPTTQNIDLEPLPRLPSGVPEMSPYAITWQEQRLIEEWDASPEKASGRMDLETWISHRGPAAGVDPCELQSKISRDA